MVLTSMALPGRPAGTPARTKIGDEPASDHLSGGRPSGYHVAIGDGQAPWERDQRVAIGRCGVRGLGGVPDAGVTRTNREVEGVW